MQRFWNYAQNNQPKSNCHKGARTAYGLPNAYRFGFRWSTDHIWGIWDADEYTTQISKSVGKLLSEYDNKLDIIYDDGSIVGNEGYSQLIYWNAYDPTPTPSPSPTPSPTPTASPTPEPTRPPEPFPTALLIAATIVSITMASGLLILHFKKRSQS
ncbi:MAG: hypothetical protein NWE96_06555 [Candidatus Bathyarchaeota archaeon]|nr:hypothetical protein [Candidatus Bathyarchaeota archaeon]